MLLFFGWKLSDPFSPQQQKKSILQFLQLMLGDWETESSDRNSLIGCGKNKWQCILFKKLIVPKIMSMITDWRAEWGYQALFSCCSSKKAGVIILFNNTFTFQISRAYCDPGRGGRFIIGDLITNGKQLNLGKFICSKQWRSNCFTFLSAMRS